MSTSSELIADEELQRRERAGYALYRERLQALLEPQENGRMVAIHLETGDYAVADTYPRAVRELRPRQPEGVIVALRIGPAFEAPAVYRAFAHQSKGQSSK